MKKILRILIITTLLLNCLTIEIYAASFKSDTYSFDSTGKYILDVPSNTTIKQFKSNVNCKSISISGVSDDTNEDSELIKTGSSVNIDEKNYTVIVLGDIDGDGQCTYKDILLEKDYYENNKSTRYDDLGYDTGSVTIGNATGGGAKIIAKCKELLSIMKKQGGWGYSKGLPKWKKKWDTAQSHKRSNCVSFVAWVYQEAGYMHKGKFISHKSSGSAIKKSFGDSTINCTWYLPNKRPSQISNLQPGDICVWSGTIAIFGKKKNGKYYFYNANDNDDFRYCINKVGPGRCGYYTSHNIKCLIRPNA